MRILYNTFPLSLFYTHFSPVSNEWWKPDQLMICYAETHTGDLYENWERKKQRNKNQKEIRK
jgi:hypothetical protein